MEGKSFGRLSLNNLFRFDSEEKYLDCIPYFSD